MIQKKNFALNTHHNQQKNWDKLCKFDPKKRT